MILCLSQASRRSESNPWIIFLSWLLMSCRVVRFRISKASSTFSRVSDGSNDLLMIVKTEKGKKEKKGGKVAKNESKSCEKERKRKKKEEKGKFLSLPHKSTPQHTETTPQSGERTTPSGTLSLAGNSGSFDCLLVLSLAQ